jgi:two-component system chemotaxis response regulator CheB
MNSGVGATATGKNTLNRRARDIVVVGASAGGVRALLKLVAGLPTTFVGVVVVVQHLPAGVTSVLPAILRRAGPLPAVPAEEGAAIEAGHILRRVTQPAPRHDQTRHHASGLRPPRVVGVVLSGTGADGTQGLKTIKTAGGIAIIQDPAEAGFADMPRYAARFDDVDYVVPVA